MARKRFVDTAHLIATLNVRDGLHQSAIELESRFARSRDAEFVTTDLVLVEFLASFSRLGSHLRGAAIRYVRGIETLAKFTVVRLDSRLFNRALDLFESRLDQRYSLTDCVSMLVCRDLGVTDVLTSDADFEHEGFNILLKDAQA